MWRPFSSVSIIFCLQLGNYSQKIVAVFSVLILAPFLGDFSGKKFTYYVILSCIMFGLIAYLFATYLTCKGWVFKSKFIPVNVRIDIRIFE